MLALLREEPGADDFAQRWRVAALAYFYDMALKTARKVREDDVQEDREGLRINIEGESYWVPLAPQAPLQRGPQDSLIKAVEDHGVLIYHPLARQAVTMG